MSQASVSTISVRTTPLIERRARLTREELEHIYLAFPGRPVILTDVVPQWSAFETWTFDRLAEHFGAGEISAYDRLVNPTQVCRMPMATFAQYCQAPARFAARLGGSALYCALQPFAIDTPALAAVTWPTAIDHVYGSLGPDVYDWFLREFGVVLIGPPDTRTPPHEDLFGTHAWLAQVRGRKRFLFLAPPDARLDRPSASASRRPSTPDDSVLEATPTYDVVVAPGELIVFPQGWRHEVIALDASISVTFNFVGRTNLTAHLLEICRDLPAWSRRVNNPTLRRALGIQWTSADFDVAPPRTATP